LDNSQYVCNIFIDEPELQNVVVLDPIAYFVTPATTIICKHVPTAIDPTHHVLDVHKKCMKKKWIEWKRLIGNGIADAMLLEAFRKSSCTGAPNDEVWIACASSASHFTSVEYLVPALLPSSVPSEWSTCNLTFSASEDFHHKNLTP
jgi:hypothetical protein